MGREFTHFLGNGRMLVGLDGASLMLYGLPLYGTGYALLEMNTPNRNGCAAVKCADCSGIFSYDMRILSDNGRLEVCCVCDTMDVTDALFVRRIDSLCELWYDIRLCEGVRLYDFPMRRLYGMTVRRLVLVMSPDTVGSEYDNGFMTVYCIGDCGYDPVGCRINIRPGRSFLAVGCGLGDVCDRLLSKVLRKLSSCSGIVERTSMYALSREQDALLLRSTSGACAADAVRLVCALQNECGAVLSPGFPQSYNTLTQCAAIWMFCEYGMYDRAEKVVRFLVSRASERGLMYGEPASYYGRSVGAYCGASVVSAAVILCCARFVSAVGGESAELVRELMKCEMERQTAALGRYCLPWCGRELPFEAGFAPTGLAGGASAEATVLYAASAREYLRLFGDDGNGRYTKVLGGVCENFRRNFVIGGRFVHSNPAVTPSRCMKSYGKCDICGASGWLKKRSDGCVCCECEMLGREKSVRRNVPEVVDVPFMPYAKLLVRLFGIADMLGLTADMLDCNGEYAAGIVGLTSPCFDALALCKGGSEVYLRHLKDAEADGVWHEYERYDEVYGDFVRASAICAAAIKMSEK